MNLRYYGGWMHSSYDPFLVGGGVCHHWKTLKTQNIRKVYTHISNMYELIMSIIGAILFKLIRTLCCNQRLYCSVQDIRQTQKNHKCMSLHYCKRFCNKNYFGMSTYEKISKYCDERIAKNNLSVWWNFFSCHNIYWWELPVFDKTLLIFHTSAI